ncbi:hypothetical protein A33M_3217 [Rhodovulum sp. PH10]|uniref:peptidoglycan-binding domain-containing protein n=1 Tax=Rhodovulum sp. PH10 TaxID=1187851 RepID=UPI00027C2531|nr:peptidoglycan-binding domain-containing protein [Rhodovulum sp. PH10]EJW11321.1 hypothetical protein A33M_3217 [Rhodovulum sp. PH10]
MREPIDDDEDEVRPVRRGAKPAKRSVVARVLLHRPSDTLASLAGLAALATVVINALYMQPGPHPAPIFALQPVHTAATRLPPSRPATGAESTGALTGAGVLSVLPRPRPQAASGTPRGEPAPAPAPQGELSPPRNHADLVTDLQRELSRRGYYDGAIDGISGSRTEAALRAFEHDAGLPVTGTPSESVLKALSRAPARGRAAAAAAARPDPIAGLLLQSSGQPKPTPASLSGTGAAAPRAAAEPRATTGSAPPVVARDAPMAPPPSNVPPGRAMAPAPVPPAEVASPRLRAVQRALSDFGYGQVKPTGVYDEKTHAAISAFEESRRLPVTGEVSERLTRELADLTGRPIE